MTLTTERLREIAEDGFLEHGDAKLMARELLANREAQPVGFRYRHKDTVSWLYNDWRWPDSVEAEQCQIEWLYTAQPAPANAQPVLYASEETLAYAKEGEKSLVTWSEPMGDAVIPLFTVQKAQTSGVVNLPTEFISDEGVMVRLEQVMAALALVGVKYERRGDACRAAMLAQPVSQRYTLPPHVFRELVNSLRDTAVKYSGTDQLRERLNTALHQFIEPDHPHTRTVAPEGGNDHDTRR